MSFVLTPWMSNTCNETELNWFSEKTVGWQRSEVSGNKMYISFIKTHPTKPKIHPYFVHIHIQLHFRCRIVGIHY